MTKIHFVALADALADGFTEAAERDIELSSTQKAAILGHIMDTLADFNPRFDSLVFSSRVKSKSEI